MNHSTPAGTIFAKPQRSKPAAVGQYRAGGYRMFQAVAANRVTRNPRLAVTDAHWRRQCLEPMQETMFSSSAILADDVAVAAAAKCPDGDTHALADSIPSWRPPFDRTWVEMDLRPITTAKVPAWTDGLTHDLQAQACGCFYRTAECNDPALIAADHADLIKCPSGPEQVRWIVSFDLWLMAEDRVLGPCCVGTMFLDTEGRPAPGMTTLITASDNSDEKPTRRVNLNEITKEEARALIVELSADVHDMEVGIRYRGAMIFALRTGVWMCGYAIGLMHCKNITTPVATDSDRRADPRLPKSGVQYRVLKVRPMTQRRGNVGQDAGEPQPLSLHVVRGHFADYRNGRGLFGKHRGLYWWSPHLRGSGENGEVVKDYSPSAAMVPA